METLFELPPKEKKKATKRGKRSQREICRRCQSALWHRTHEEIYCTKFDLCLYAEEDRVLRLTKNNQAIQCDGKAWEY